MGVYTLLVATNRLQILLSTTLTYSTTLLFSEKPVTQLWVVLEAVVLYTAVSAPIFSRAAHRGIYLGVFSKFQEIERERKKERERNRLERGNSMFVDKKNKLSSQGVED